MNIPVVILHGWGASAKSYDKLKPLLEEQKGISVFVFDLPGFGSEPAPKDAWSVDDYVEWVSKWLEKNVKIHPSPPLQKEGVVLFGHSFGGRIVIKLAAKYPDKLAGLILCDAAGITPRPKTKITIFGLLSKTGKIVFSLPILKYFQPIVRKIEYFLAGSRDYYYLQEPIMKETFKKIIEEDLTPYLEKINVPTLIILGKKDKMTPISDARTMHNKIKNSELEILEGIGHSPHLECPKKLSDIIVKFISSNF